MNRFLSPWVVLAACAAVSISATAAEIPATALERQISHATAVGSNRMRAFETHMCK